MAKDDREILEGIARDIAFLSMEYIGTPEDEYWNEIRELTDDELVAFICDR